MAVTICLAVLLPRLGAQTVTEDFAAGFSADLAWQGDLDAFAGEDGRLVLRENRAEPSNTARVSFAAATRDSACWTLDVDQDFSASSSNRLQYWLAADRPLLGGDARGYYLQFGGISGSDDALELFHEDGGARTLVAAGTAGLAAADPLTLSVRVCAAADQTWTFAARDLGDALVETASGTGPVPLAGAHVGLDVRFTATRSGLLSVDDLSVGPVVVDREAPRLVFATAPTAATVLLLPSEPLGEGSLEVSNYRVGGETVAAVARAGDSLRLTLAAPLMSGVATAVTIANWLDAAGNESGALETSVTFTAPRELTRYEVLITEIMADPTPVIGLPESEFVELYNAGAQAVDLSGLSIATPRTEARLPDVTLAPGAYVALAGEETNDERFVPFEALPTLTNGGSVLQLRSGGRVIDEVAYDDALYPSGKRDGGFSLERIDLAVPCALAADNFAASVAIAGGTPGAENSVRSRLGLRSLALTSAGRRGMDTLVVSVNRVLDGALAEAFLIGDRAPVSVSAGEMAGTYVLALAEPLRVGEVVEVALAPAARSCVEGEIVSTEGLAVGIAEASAPGDWALNEIMYDPLSGQGRWVELVNVSEKLLSLDDLLLAETESDGTLLEVFEVAAGTLVGPGGYLVVAADPAALRVQYPDARASATAEADVPTLGEEGCLSLVDAVAEERYFTVCYTGDWHNGALANTDGVSLERIDLEARADDANNWTSAASTVGFATPTLPNSQARTAAQAAGGDAVTLQQERLSPDGDGFEDLLAVDYAFDAPGTLVSFEVVDVQGRSVFRPAEQEAVGLAGTWTWDGVTDEGGVADVGTYVLRGEWFGEGRRAERAFLAFSVVGGGEGGAPPRGQHTNRPPTPPPAAVISTNRPSELAERGGRGEIFGHSRGG